MQSDLFLLIIILSFVIYFIPNKYKYFFTLFLLLSGIVLSSIWSIQTLFISNSSIVIDLNFDFINYDFSLTIDKLSAFFLLVVNFTSLTGFIYAYKYLEPYRRIKYPLSFSIHYFSYLWLYLSMIMVVMLQDGVAFIILWEIMALSSFMLVIFNAETRSIMKTGISYLIQMHIGMFFILIAFLLAEKATGIMGFAALTPYFSDHSNIFLFILFFIGFGMKAGFIPLHTWLPQAHPAAPSHVSGVMSGVMIKMGIYGILRVVISLQNDLFVIGNIILFVSLISGILGVMMAIVQHDIKRLLAYHSIENIGIIGIGIGLGVIGLSVENTGLILLGFSGGLLHVLNHSLFKSLLFYNAGSINQAARTRNVEHLGGLIKKMPYTAVFFLIGSLAICGLPPFNGFISEYLIYSGMFKTLSGSDLYLSFIILSGIVGLTLIGGLALFCFTKAFGITFLGQARSIRARSAKEVSKFMLFPSYLIVGVIMFVGLASSFFVVPTFNIVIESFGLTGIHLAEISTVSNNLLKISAISGLFIILTIVLLFFRKYHLKNKLTTIGDTWGCGYTAGSSSHQYTSTSFANNFVELANPILRSKKKSKKIEDDDIFPETRHFKTQTTDIFKDYLINYPKNFLLSILKKIAVMQTGQINHYILYTFLFIIIALILTYFELI
jgi:hydrogenase-4 component B